MANQKPQTYINVVPNIKLKKEPIEEEEEDSISCRMCLKCFSNETALRNHARMEHFEAFVSGEPLEDEEKRVTSRKIKRDVEPPNVLSLASENVSYIVIQQSTGLIQTLAGSNKPRERVRKRKVERKASEASEEPAEMVPVVKEPKKARDKEPEPITGPFECLQPSTLVEDGTCHQIFFSCCEYSVHFRDEHTRRRKGLRCQVCEKPLALGAESTAPYPCEVCGAGFDTNKELSNHTATEHVKLKPFECNVCHKRFTQQGGVQQHMRMHTGDRPFPCTFCSKAFTQKSGLDQHLRTHTKVKPYRCVICSKTFSQSVHLKQHMRTHTNVSPFQCGICSKRFKQSSHLNYHLKNHNPANMSAEQRVEYQKLIRIMNGNLEEQVLCVLGDDSNVEMVEVEDTESEEVLEEMVEVDQEQILAEQSIQEIDDEDYVLGDDGSEVWSVKLVEK